MERTRLPALTGDMLRIEQGLAAAELEERNVDDRTARLLASQLHAGQKSAMYSLASTGAVNYERLREEILADYGTSDPDTRRMLDHLGTYVIEHDGRGPVRGWHQLTADEAEPRRQEQVIGQYHNPAEAARETLRAFGVFDAVAAARAQVAAALGDYIMVDVEGFAETHPGFRFEDHDDGVRVIREL